MTPGLFQVSPGLLQLLVIVQQWVDRDSYSYGEKGETERHGRDELGSDTFHIHSYLNFILEEHSHFMFNSIS